MKIWELTTNATLLVATTMVVGGCDGGTGQDGASESMTSTTIDVPVSTADGDELGTGADESSGETEDVPETCGVSTFELEHKPTNVMLVLDKSYSMVENYWDHDDQASTPFVTRWNSLHSSVSFIIDEFDAGLNFGAVLFPSTDVPDNEWETACMVGLEPDAPVAPNNGELILASLPGPEQMQLFGGTPASEGIATALNHLRSLSPVLPRAMILVTDGAANCLAGTTNQNVFNLYDENLSALVGSAFEDEDIPTYVIGIDIIDGWASFPQDNPYQRLNEVAIAGGFPRPGSENFHNAQNEDELRAAISQVTSQIGCTIPLEKAPFGPDLLSIVINGDRIPMVDSCEMEAVGWHYTNPAGPYDEVELCADACSSLHNSGSLSVNYHCIPQG